MLEKLEVGLDNQNPEALNNSHGGCRITGGGCECATKPIIPCLYTRSCASFGWGRWFHACQDYTCILDDTAAYSRHSSFEKSDGCQCTLVMDESKNGSDIAASFIAAQLQCPRTAAKVFLPVSPL